ncbi:MAG: transglycosylase domain-containing protein [Deltaproteobacteria bacterium]|nr:transglycosylase domain-containing protein [Deltaproteobacteria bacterium]
MATVFNTVRKPRRRWPWVLGGAAFAFAALCTALFFGLGPLATRLAKGAVDQRLSELSEVIGRQVVVSGLSSGLTEDLVLEGVVVPSTNPAHPTLRVPRIRLDFSLWDALMGRRLPRRLEAEALSITVYMEDGRADDLVDLYRGLKKLGRHGDGGTQGTGIHSGPSWNTAGIQVVADGAVDFVDKGSGSTLVTLRGLHLDARVGGPGSVTIRFSGKALGLSEGEAAVVGSLSWSADRRRATFEADRPLDPTLLLGKTLPVTAKLAGCSVEFEPSRNLVTADLRGLELPDVAPLTGTPAIDRLFQSFGTFRADRVRLTANLAADSSPWAPLSFLPKVDSLAFWDGGFDAMATDPRLGRIQVRQAHVSLTRGDSDDEILVSGDGEIGGNRTGWSRLEARARLGGDGTLRELNGSAKGPGLVGLLSKVHPHLLPWSGAELGLNLVVKGDGKRYGFVGRLDGRGLSYLWTKLCLVPVTDVDLGMDFTAMLDLPGEKLNIKADPIAIGSARFSLEMDVSRFLDKPRIKLRFSIPKQRCEDVAAAIPPVMIPRLEGARFDGWMELDLVARVDFNKVNKASLRVSADLEECKALGLGPRVNVARLLSRRFVHRVHEEDLDRRHIRLGPGTDSWTPLEDIPVPVQQAALATEDMDFFDHSGFQVGLMRRAVRLNLERGWYVYGGSTISQQLVKNLFLSREKTLARKLEEAIIVWVMEGKLEKERILELYLNCIEFGRHIYGIRSAAREYYDKTPQELTALEGAFIMATKPKPRYAHKIYRQRSFNDWWVKRMKGILERLHEPMDVIGYRTTVTPDPCPPDGPRGKYLVPCFYYAEEDLYTQPEVSPDTEIPPGMPEELPTGQVKEEPEVDPAP